MVSFLIHNNHNQMHMRMRIIPLLEIKVILVQRGFKSLSTFTVSSGPKPRSSSFNPASKPVKSSMFRNPENYIFRHSGIV